VTPPLRLVVTDGPDRGRKVELGHDEAVIGSHIDCAMVLAATSSTSSRATAAT
jgi:hypothetical protein